MFSFEIVKACNLPFFFFLLKANADAHIKKWWSHGKENHHNEKANCGFGQRLIAGMHQELL